MIELLLIFYFSRKIRKLAEERGIIAGRWIAKLVIYWFVAELSVFAIGIYFLGQSEDTLLKLVVPALVAAIATAFFVINKLKAIEIEEDLTLDEFSKQSEDDFKHFR